VRVDVRAYSKNGSARAQTTQGGKGNQERTPTKPTDLPVDQKAFVVKRRRIDALWEGKGDPRDQANAPFKPKKSETRWLWGEDQESCRSLDPKQKGAVRLATLGIPERKTKKKKKEMPEVRKKPKRRNSAITT